MPFISAGAALALLYLVRFCWASESWAKTVVKTGALGLPAVGLALMGWPPLFLAGLAACVLGDFLLSRPGQRALMAGIGAFALGHILYVVAMVAGFDLSPVWALSVALIALGLSTERWLAPHTGDMRGPVRGYVVLILSMGIVAAMTGVPLIIWGALAFIASDLILSVELFRAPRGTLARAAPFAIWGLYVLAQALLILGFAPEGF